MMLMYFVKVWVMKEWAYQRERQHTESLKNESVTIFVLGQIR